MSIRFTSSEFPLTPGVKDATGLPWGCVLQPFSPIPSDCILGPESMTAKDISRCSECFAYMNPYSTFMRAQWRCALCGNWNEITDRKYLGTDRRTVLPELAKDLIEVDLAAEEMDSEAFAGRPCYIATVDLTGPADYLELVKSGLLAAVEALPGHCMFGLAVFGVDVGLFDLRSENPALRRMYAPDGSELELGLEEALPLPSFLVPVEEYKLNITMALESLTSLGPPPVKTGTRTGNDDGEEEEADTSRQRGVPTEKRKRCFGSCIRALVDYLAVYEGFASCRVLAFLSGAPNAGIGVLNENRIKELAGSDAELLIPDSSFYREQAERAVEIGVCVDLFVVSNRYTDLASLKFLCTKTGGKMMLYESTVNCTLPQDMYRQLSRPQAAQGLLRVRTSPEFSPSVYYGNLYADPGYANLYHVVGCDDFSCFAVDFEFEDAAGFSSAGERAAGVVQVAFAYTCVSVEQAEAGNDDDDPQNRQQQQQSSNDNNQAMTTRTVVKRRLRIHTVKVPATSRTRSILDSACPDVIMSVLAQKIIRAALDEGVGEARLLLQDWLAILLARFNATTRADRPGGEVTVSFAGCDALLHLPRYVYGLLRHNLMSSDNVHPDERVFLQVFFSSLQPHFLLNSIYPTLSSFSDENTPADPVMCLAQGSLDSSGAGIFLMDSFTGLHVYIRGKDVPSPSQGSLLRKKVAELKMERHVTPHVTIARAGESDARHFVAGLIEDSPGSDMTYTQFLEVVRSSVTTALAAS